MKLNNYILFILGIVMLSCTSEKVVNISDYPIITTIEELTNNYELNFDKSGTFEKCIATNYLDGSYELEYEYDLTETYEFDPLFYSINIKSESTIEDAIDIYELSKKAILITNELVGFGKIEIDSINIPGETNFYAIRTLEGEPNGILFMTRQGKKIYTLITSGLYSVDHSILTDLIFPKIVKLNEFKLND